MAGSYSFSVTRDEARSLQTRFAAHPLFHEATRPYALFCYEGMDASAAYYEEKRRLVIQGRGADALIDLLELHAPEQPELAMDVPQTGEEHPETNVPHIGVDESGKGDYFGPLVVAGVYADEGGISRLVKLGCRDSKQIHSEQRIASIAAEIRATPGVEAEVICIGPRRYNALYEQMRNLNRLLAWGHARVIATLHARVPSCEQALSDQFANEYVLRHALAATGTNIQLHQRPRAEEDPVVAAASILARARFVEWVSKTAEAARCELPLGSANHVLEAARAFVEKHGRERLPDVAKMHFKLTNSI